MASGYRIHNIETLSTRFKCLYCQLIIREAQQITVCGHRVCNNCLLYRISANPNEKLRCPNEDCQTPFVKSEVMSDRAFNKELDKILVECYHKIDGTCQWNGELRLYQEHLDSIHAQEKCPHCHETFPSASLVTDHINTNCTHFFMQCPLAPYCINQLIRKDQYSEHLYSHEHQKTIALLANGNIDLNQFMESDADMNPETQSTINSLQESLSQKLSVISEKIERFNDDTVSLYNAYIKISELTKQSEEKANSLQCECEERYKQLIQIQNNQMKLEKQLEEIEDKLEKERIISTDGTFTWRIDNVSQLIVDAQSERKTNILSPPFYSSPNGYKMAARLYLNGDGPGKRTHLSLFFLLMKGEFDALLPWPFNHKVTFTLLAQSSTGNNHHDSFRPDIKSNSFQKPTTEMNIASGIPKFIQLPMLLQDGNPYIVNDTMFVRIIVDLVEVPKQVQTVLLNLNPGLPRAAKQKCLEEEIKKIQKLESNQSFITQNSSMEQ